MAIDISQLTAEDRKALIASMSADERKTLVKEVKADQTKEAREAIAAKRVEVGQKITGKVTIDAIRGSIVPWDDTAFTGTKVVLEISKDGVTVSFKGGTSGGARAEGRDLKAILEEYGTDEEKAEMAFLRAANKAARTKENPNGGGEFRGKMTTLLNGIWNRAHDKDGNRLSVEEANANLSS